MKGVMVDLETMGNGSNAAIIALGAVKFDSSKVEGAQISDTFYKLISLESSVKSGGVMDASTVIWWLNQSDNARKMFNPGQQRMAISLNQCLDVFSGWLGMNQKVWGNGASFDNPILTNAYKNIGLNTPWKFWNDRCYRTVKALYPKITLEFDGVKHNALADATHQANHLCKILNAIEVP